MADDNGDERWHRFYGPRWPDDACSGVGGPGQGWHWVLGWDMKAMTYMAVLFDDDPEDEEEPWLVAGVRPVDVLTLDELELRMEVQLPDEIKQKLVGDKADHFGGLRGEPAEAVRRRLRALAWGELVEGDGAG